jgi:hypothetical protein
VSPRWDRFGWLIVAHGFALLIGIVCALAALGPARPWSVFPLVVVVACGLLVSIVAYWTGRRDGAP